MRMVTPAGVQKTWKRAHLWEKVIAACAADEKFKRAIEYDGLDKDGQKKMRESFERKFKDAEKAYKKLKDKMRPSGSGGELAFALEISTCAGYKLLAADPTRNLSVEPIGNETSPSETTSTGHKRKSR